MEHAAIEARHLTLIRFEHAAGAAFGCHDDAATPSARLFTTWGTVALAALAIVFAAAIAYLV